MKAPILLVIFNRPDTTEKVFEAIRKAKPEKLYISADAPRNDNKEDEINCEKTRSICKKIDWKCDVHYRFLDNNLGCGYGPSTAISWAFENEECLIILEDDCVPSLPFFEYCNHCLKRYYHDYRVWLISGRCHHEDSIYFDKYDYIFSHYGHTWGWATWKRCWKYFDIDMKKWEVFKEQGAFLNSYLSIKEGVYFNKLFYKLIKEKKLASHAWDYQFILAGQMQGGLSITPSKNLIQNIGSIGTHSNGLLEVHRLLASEEYKIEKEPEFILANRKYDLMHFNTHINPKKNIVVDMIINGLRLLKIK
jgi:hypothetical protein